MKSMKRLEARNAKRCAVTASFAIVSCINPPIIRKAIHTPTPDRTILARRSWILLNKVHAALTQYEYGYGYGCGYGYGYGYGHGY